MSVYFVILAAIVYGFVLVEAGRAHRNELTQRARGGIEATGDVYRTMRIVYPAAFALMIAEGAWRGVPPPVLSVAGAAVFAIAKALKWWAIGVLGVAWTFRVIVVPGTRLVAAGPYRLMRHPNYVAVIGELVAVALLSGALIAGPLGIVAFSALIARRVAVEERALNAILRR